MSKITLSWTNLSNIHTGQNIYKSLTSFDSSTLPTALTTLPKGVRSYVDNDVVEGLSYYYAVSTVSGSGELVSEVKKIDAVPSGGDPYWSSVVFFAPLTVDMEDKSSRLISTSNVGSCVIDDSDGAIGVGCLSTPSAGFLEAVGDFKFGSSDFTIELFAKTSANSPPYFGLFSFEHNGTDFNLWTITGAPSKTWISSTGASWNIASSGNSGSVTDGNWHHWALVRSGTKITVYRDGVSVFLSNLPSGTQLTQKGGKLSLGTKDSNASFGAASKFQYVRVTKGVARYAENFTPPTTPFPDY